MKTTAQTIHATTQKFIEVQEIKENIVLLNGGNACIVIQVTATNFALLSKEEQDAKMFAYASLLNSLSFPIQILIRNKRVQIEPYLHLLDAEAEKTVNPKLATNIKQYREFVESIVQLTSVLDKQFYFVISFSSLETGIKNASSSIVGSNPNDADAFFSQAKSSLKSKAETLLSQVERLGLRGKLLQKDDLVKLFYDIYNQDTNASLQSDPETVIKTFAVKGEKKA